MLRKLCIVTVFLHHFHYYLEFNCVSADISPISNIVDVLNRFKFEIKHYISANARIFERRRRLVKDGLLKLFKDVRDVKTLQTTTKHPPKFLRIIKPRMTPRMTTMQLIMGNGYKAEEHTIHTNDGYLLSIYRILANSKLKRYGLGYVQGSISLNRSSSVLLHHGLYGSSEDWLLSNQATALPYLLSDLGYDVWLLNARGNKYAKLHTYKLTESSSFWNFSWHEMGIYDLPAVIQYVNDHTNDTDLYYIGHSMGATALLVLLSTIPEYNFKLKSAILLAPLAFMYHAKGPVRAYADLSNSTNLTRLLGRNEFMPDGSFQKKNIEKFCQGIYRTCLNPLLLLASGGKKKVDTDLMDNVLTYLPAGGSTKTLLHYIQLIKNGRFRMFDYGTLNNLMKYKKAAPPNYNLSAISLPISIISSTSDWLATMADTITLVTELENVQTFHVVGKEDFGHLDFVWSKYALTLVFNLVMNILNSVSVVKKNDATGDSQSILSTTETNKISYNTTITFDKLRFQ